MPETAPMETETEMETLTGGMRRAACGGRHAAVAAAAAFG